MKCPMFDTGKVKHGSFYGEGGRECTREECAWWLEDIQMCSVRELALETRYTQFRLQDMLAKMPPAKE